MQLFETDHLRVPRLTVAFHCVYDHVDDVPLLTQHGTGYDVDDCWRDVCDRRCRDTTEMSYDDWSAA